MLVIRIGISVVLLGVTVFMSACLSDVGSEAGEDTIDVPPKLENLIVEFAAWDPSSENVGAFRFDSTFIGDASPADPDKVFLEFGASVDGNTKPTFEYIVRQDAVVRVPVNGIITRIDSNQEIEPDSPTNDYEIQIQTSEDSNWAVVIDHVVPEENLSLGDPIRAGDPVGKPGTWYGPASESWIDAGFGRVELMVLNFGGGSLPIAQCPMNPDLWSNESLRQEYIAKLEQFIADWQSFAAPGGQPIYGDFETEYTGCRALELEG